MVILACSVLLGLCYFVWQETNPIMEQHERANVLRSRHVTSSVDHAEANSPVRTH